jgi:hypothetical protein
VWVLVPKALNSSAKFRRVDNFRGVALGERGTVKIGGKGDRNWDVICDVVTTFIVIRKGMNILMW